MALLIGKNGESTVYRDKPQPSPAHHRNGYLVRKGKVGWEIVKVTYNADSKFRVVAIVSSEQEAEKLAFELGQDK